MIGKFARSRGLLSPKSEAALERLAEGDFDLSASERNAVEYLAQQFRAQGEELTDFLRQEG